MSALANRKDVRYALSAVLENGAEEFLIRCAGQDLPDSMLTLEGLKFDIKRTGGFTFRISAADDSETETMHFDVSIR